MEFSQTVLEIAECVGIVAFAVSGAMVAIDHELDLFGVILIGILTALGGGCIRDLLLGAAPPRMFYNYRYVLMATLISAAVFCAAALFKKRYQEIRPRANQLINLFDAIGLGIFSVTGVQMAVDAGYADNPFMCIFLGMTTGVGGGILRDLLTQQTPYVLRKHIYAVASIIGGGLYFLLIRLGISYTVSVIAGMALTVLIRLLAAHFRWSLPKLHLSVPTDLRR